MKKRLLFSMIIVALLMLASSRSFAKLDILREIDDIVEASKPNVLLIIATGKAMTRAAGESGGGVNDNEGDIVDIGSGSPGRLFMVKDVLVGILDSSVTFGSTTEADYDSEDGVLDATKEVINFGLMTYNQTGYYSYYSHNAYNNNGTFSTSSGYPGGYQGFNVNYSGNPYYFEYFWEGSENPPFNAKYPIESATAGGLLVKIDTDDTLSQDDPTGTSYSDEVTVIKKFLALQKDGGLALDQESSGDTRIDDVFKLDDGDDYNDAYEYFRNQVIPGDANSSSGCFTKNYVIYIADGFGNSSAFSDAADNAESLYNLTVSGIDTPVKTFVIGVVDTSAAGMGNMQSRLNEIARQGGTDASEKVAYGLQRTSIPADHGGDFAFFVTDRDELQIAFLNIASVIAAGDYVTGAPSATSSGSTYVTNDIGILPSAEYPSWRGHLRAVDLVNDQFWWDAGTTLFIPAADTNLPKATEHPDIAIPSPLTDLSIWRDTDGDLSADQPPYKLKHSGDVYQYTDKVLYCEDGTSCNSSDLISYKYVGSTATFTISSVDTTYNYIGAFYLKPYTDRKIYTSKLDGSLLEIDPSVAATVTAIKTLAGWDDGSVSDEQAKAYLYFGVGALDLDADGSVDTGVDLNEDGDTSDTTADGIVEATAEVVREWWLGDITNIVPVTVGAPIEPGDGLSREDFQDDFADRTNNPVVYTGSNDGMLHAYNFYTGDELFAYVPPDLLPKLKTLYDNAVASADPASFTGQETNPTDHIYGIASSPKVNDVWIDPDGDGTSEWHTVLVTGEGPGGNHYFALDVTHPYGETDYNGSSWATEKRYDTTTAPFDMLWHTIETSPNNLAASYGSTLGETWSVPAFGRINNGGTDEWVVFAGSGYDDTNIAANYSGDEGEIYHIIKVEDGTLSKSVDIAEVSSEVQYGLVPDAVSIIKKDGSTVRASYELDLEGRVNHITTIDSNSTNWTKTQLTKAGVLEASNTSNPFYFSPAIWDFDNETSDALNFMVFGSGAYDDSEQDDLTGSDKLYFSIINPATPAITDAFSINIKDITGTRVNSDGDFIDSDGNVVGTAEDHDISDDSRLLASPVLFKNSTSNNLEALFLIFDPPATGTLGCSFGNSYLLVFNLGSHSTFEGSSASDTFSGTDITAVKAGIAQNVVSVGSGKVSGIGMAGGSSHAVVGESGHGYGSTSGFNTAGGSTWNPVGDTTKLYWKEE